MDQLLSSSEQEGSTFGARWGQTNLCATSAAHDGGADGKVIIERLCISLPYVKTFNSKVIKGFVPELRSRYVFFVFRDSYVLCIYVRYGHYFLRTGLNMSISHIHIWLCNILHPVWDQVIFQLYNTKRKFSEQ